MYVHATAPYVCSPEVEIDELKAELKILSLCPALFLPEGI